MKKTVKKIAIEGSKHVRAALNIFKNSFFGRISNEELQKYDNNEPIKHDVKSINPEVIIKHNQNAGYKYFESCIKEDMDMSFLQKHRELLIHDLLTYFNHVTTEFCKEHNLDIEIIKYHIEDTLTDYGDCSIDVEFKDGMKINQF